MITKHNALGDSLREKLDTIVRQLPPEDREKVTFEDGELKGPPELVAKVKDLVRREDGKGSAGD